METFKRLFIAAFALLLCSPLAANAHPMGNFSINHYSKLTLDGEQIFVDYILDFAEIPTFQMFPEVRVGSLIPRSGSIASGWMSRVALAAGGQALPLTLVGIWAAASRPMITILRNNGTVDTNGKMVQVSRLGNPLVNELFSPLKVRDRWNATDPSDDIQYRQNQVVAPEIPAIVDLLYGTNTPSSGAVVRALKPFPTTNRTDLELILYKGIPVNGITGPNFTTVIGGDLNRAKYADELRLNLAILPNVMGSLPDMNNPGDRRLGLLGGDAAGFPNGRRLFDDTVDIFLRAGAGGTPFTSVLFPGFSGPNDPNAAPNNALTDGVDRNPEGFLPAFPYLQTPVSGFDSPHAVIVP